MTLHISTLRDGGSAAGIKNCVIIVSERIKEYLRLGRLFNAEVLSVIFILSYILTAHLYNTAIDGVTLVGLFIMGILTHIWGCYNNDRLDLSIDKQATYCSHKPLVSGSISVKTAKIIENLALVVIFGIAIYLSPKVTTPLYLFGLIALAYLYNRLNKSNMFINIVGQMYACFAVLVGMSIIVDFDFTLFLSAIVMGLNGVYLNIIEADLKDVEGDTINVPKALGLKFKGGKAVNKIKFYALNEGMKLVMFVLILWI
ncbi:UbiA prenyltransferase family protein, partial [bacterium]|nr:UbiA prenyltransferase family protein [bacterium]